MVRRCPMTLMAGAIVLLAGGCDPALLTSLLGSTTPAGTPPGEIATISELRFDGSETDARGVAAYDGDPGFLQYGPDREGAAGSALVLEKSGGTEDPDVFRYSLGDHSSAGVRTVAFWMGSANVDESASCQVVVGDRAALDAALTGDWRASLNFAESAYLDVRLQRNDASSLNVTARAWGEPDIYIWYQGNPGADTTWLHVAAVIDAARILRVYVNGQPRTSTDLAVAGTGSGEDLAIAILASTGPNVLLDDLVLLETPLGPGDVEALYAGELALP